MFYINSTEKKSGRSLYRRTSTMNPVIGIIGISNDKHDRLYHISTVYISWLRTHGCHVIYIHPMWTPVRLYRVLQSIDGVVFPGSNNHPYSDEPVFRTFSRILAYAVESKKFPVYGICCGLQSIATYFSGKSWNSMYTYVDNVWTVRPTYFRATGTMTNVFKHLSSANTHNYNHRYGITVDTFHKSPHLSDNFQIQATSFSKNEKYASIEFVSTMIHKHVPIFATMFHPEKANYEWAPKQKNIDRSIPSVTTGEHISAFFVELCRLYANEKHRPNRAMSGSMAYDVSHLKAVYREPRGFDDALVRVYLPRFPWETYRTFM